MPHGITTTHNNTLLRQELMMERSEEKKPICETLMLLAQIVNR